MKAVSRLAFRIKVSCFMTDFRCITSKYTKSSGRDINAVACYIILCGYRPMDAFCSFQGSVKYPRKVKLSVMLQYGCH